MTALVDRTHGRWPWLAAAAAGPATALALARRDWLAEELRWSGAAIAAGVRRPAAGALGGVAGSVGMMVAMRGRLARRRRNAN